MGKKVYLAGFDVFRSDAQVYGASCKMLCAQYGLEGLYPLDNESDRAEDIFAGNLALIDRCDVIAARLDPFRGSEPDSGTSFELGYAYARGKRLYGYLADGRALREKLGEKDTMGFSVEDFEFPVNLMLAVPAVLVSGDLEDCLRRIEEDERSLVK